jgi:hypothetical protein
MKLTGKEAGEDTESDFSRILSRISILPKHFVNHKYNFRQSTTERRGGAQ